MAVIQPGFADPVGQAQAVFRAALTALSRPGLVGTLPADLRPPKPLSPELAALALALADSDAPIWLDKALSRERAVTEYLRFHTGAPIVSDPTQASFALVRRPDELPAPGAFSQGTQDFPDRSTTVVIGVDRLDDGAEFAIMGPGVKGIATFSASPLPDDFLPRAAANHDLFPRGVDWLLVGQERILGLPRSSVISHVPIEEAA